MEIGAGWVRRGKDNCESEWGKKKPLKGFTEFFFLGKYSQQWDRKVAEVSVHDQLEQTSFIVLSVWNGLYGPGQFLHYFLYFLNLEVTHSNFCQTCSLQMLVKTVWFVDDPLEGFRTWLLKRIASHTKTNWWKVPWSLIPKMLTLLDWLKLTDETLSLYFLMMGANFEYNLDLMKAAADIFPFLLSMERICWSGMVVPLTLIGLPNVYTFTYLFIAWCLHQGSALLWLKGTLPPCFLFF